MTSVHLIAPSQVSPRLSTMINASTNSLPTKIINISGSLPDLRNKKLLFAVDLSNVGVNIPILKFLSELSDNSSDPLSGSTAALLITSPNELHTKNAAQTLIFLANQLGCRFIGHPLVEATHSLDNLLTWQKSLNMPVGDILIELCSRLGKRLVSDELTLVSNPKILALHASSNRTSNTLMLWNKVKESLYNCEIEELHVENGTIMDCKGCSYIMCNHFGKQSRCFYGGTVVEEIFPAIERSNAVLWICPNYNDAISANLTAVINRMTSLYRKAKFYDKSLLSIIVSGNSGSDTVARQLIGSLNINKGFRLPPNFSLMATANDPGKINSVPNIEEMARSFAANIMREIKV
jgi:multimeric flavodoxin WrbA